MMKHTLFTFFGTLNSFTASRKEVWSSSHREEVRIGGSWNPRKGRAEQREIFDHQQFQVPKMEGFRITLFLAILGVAFPLNKPYIQLL